MDKTQLTLGSLFDGSGGFPLGGILAGVKPVFNSEIEPFPILVTHKRLPQVKHYGDVSRLSGAELPPVDIITFGSPCQDLSIAGKRAGIHDGDRSSLFFQAIRIIKEMRDATNGRYPRYCVWENVCFHGDTLITCENGYKKIKDISVGEKVKTHSGRFMPVAKVYQTPKQRVMKLRVSGSEDILVTPNHPFLTIKKIYSGKSVVGVTEPEWVSAEKLTKDCLIGYRYDVPTLPEDFMTEAEAWAVGRWIADGSVDLTKSNPRMFFSIGIGKESDAREHLGALPYQIYENKPHSTATNFCFTSREFYSLIAEVGKGAGNKKVPPYVFQMPLKLQKAVLNGYLSGDGFIRQRGKCIELSASSASRELAYGIARLIRNVYHAPANISKRPVKSGQINGRTIHANYPCYAINASLTNSATLSVIGDEIIWQPVKSVEPVSGTTTVYNLSVLEDNTYAANDIIVHNCGAFSSHGGDDFKAVLEAAIGIKEEGITVPPPENHRWPKSDVYLGDGWSVAYRVFDAQYWGVPQRRARIYLVADFAGGSAPEVLFKSEGLSGYSPQGSRPWERTAGGAAESTGETGGRSDTGGRTYCLNTQGNSGVGITEDKALALVAQDHGNHPAVLHAAGFSTEHSAKARSIGYEEEVSPTLRAGVVPAALEMFENHSQDTRYKGPLEVAQPVTATYGMGGNNQPLIVENHPTDGRVRIREDDICQTLTGRAGTGGGNVPLVAEPQIRAFGVCSKRSNSMLSDNPHSGFYEATTSRTLDQSGGNAVSSNQGGICVVAPAPETYSLQGSMIGRSDENGPRGGGFNKDVCFSLNTIDRHAVAAPEADHYCTSKNSHHTVAAHEQANTLVASDWKDPPVVNDAPNAEPVYIVRRLTPVECARLQGFPDWWCADLAIPDPSDADIAFWTEVWETWRQVTNPNGKPKTEKQIRKWLADPYTDSAEYKLWGNGIHLGTAYFVLAGIAWAAQRDTQE